MNIQEKQATINIFNKLKPIAKKLERLDVKSCNGEITDEKYDIETDKLMSKAQLLAELIDLNVYHQSDPRGCSLYLIDKTMNDTNYSHGIAVF